MGVAFGEATLVVMDGAGRPLTHWSLPAVERMNPGERPAIFAPDGAGTETLEIDDREMIEAIETVRRTLEKRRARPGRLRQTAIWGTVAAAALIVVFWLPGALLRQALSSVPPVKRSEIGATLLGHLQRATGPACRNPLGVEALGRLQTRVLGEDAPGQVVVVPGRLPGALYLPGGIIVLSREMVEGAPEGAVVAGHILAAAVSRTEADPLAPILRAAGTRATVTLFTTGDLPETALVDQAQRLLTNPPPRAGADDLAAAFEVTQVPLAPWAEAVGDDALAASDPLAGRSPPEVMSDGDWVSIQGICRG
ncbi:hypothetical protein [Wenxinia marina]|uniref:Wenxma_12, whole genome shotgun sequence n=1 Tax=Wenxinia marina DSM 24838 TaxID=1123501 RepID=A0A0D0Q1V2_9RHOB|nr:hypothetical protein [Wenxinia marina]KIQ68539.1 hypothetical protein Wenmar_02810 [Wenxinia marina DSM 24838]GGL66726.1 hypothetical protein GCM10011392_21530 [Wenxinia marina]